MEKPFLSVILPSFNERDNISSTVHFIYSYLQKKDYDFEVIVVDDGSDDSTPQIVKDLSENFTKLYLIRHKINQGKGEAVKRGMLSARGKIRVFLDADYSTSINHIEEAQKWIDQGFHIVFGSRDIKGAKLLPPQSVFRRLLGKGFRFLVRTVHHEREILDTQCGFKVFIDEAAKDIFSKSKIDGFAFDIEVLLLARKLGYKIKEMPVVWRNNPKSRVKMKHVFQMLRDIIKIKYYFHTKIYEKR